MIIYFIRIKDIHSPIISSNPNIALHIFMKGQNRMMTQRIWRISITRIMAPFINRRIITVEPTEGPYPNTFKIIFQYTPNLIVRQSLFSRIISIMRYLTGSRNTECPIPSAYPYIAVTISWNTFTSAERKQHVLSGKILTGNGNQMPGCYDPYRILIYI